MNSEKESQIDIDLAPPVGKQDPKLQKLFKDSLRLVAITNLAQFTILIGNLTQIEFLSNVVSQQTFLTYGVSVILMIDLYLTFRMITSLYNYTGNDINRIVLICYLLVSGFTRLFLLFESVVDQNFGITYYYLILTTGFLFGILLKSAVENVGITHREEFLAISWVNILGILGFVPQLTQLFVGLKIFLTLPAAIVYIIVFTELSGQSKLIEKGEEETKEIEKAESNLFLNEDLEESE